MNEMTEKTTESNDGKRLVINRHTIFTIPNFLVLIRILCVPVYMTLVILSSKAAYADRSTLFLFLGLGIMVFAALTDIVDGKIARKYKAGTKFGKHTVKYDQGTYLGQLVDPIADKAMHIGAIVALAMAGYLHWAFIIFLVLREMCMVVIGTLVVNDVNVKANMMGKVASATLSCGIILCFFHPWISKLWGNYGIDWIVVTIGLTLNWIAAINYAVDTFKQLKAKKLADAAAKIVVDTEDKK